MTDELIRREDALECFMGYDRTGDIFAAIAALPAVTVGVKPLVWQHEARNGWKVGVAWTTGYHIIRRDDGWHYGNGAGGIFPTIDAAKAAAQADYEARILAALEPAAPDPAAIREAALREAALREALKALDSLPEYGSPDVNIGVNNAYSAIRALIPKGAADDRGPMFGTCACGMTGPCMWDKCKHPHRKRSRRMTAPDLKPCPFCGGEAFLNDFAAKHGGMKPETAVCPQCSKCGTSKGYYNNSEIAIAAWNTRAPLAEALAVPTEAQIASACLSYDHSFGLMDGPQRVAMMHQAREWLHAWRKEFAALEPMAAPDLTDPVTVHANMLRGTIAKPTVEQIIHLYGVDALTKALAPVIVREAGIDPVAAPDPAAIREAALREAAKRVTELMTREVKSAVGDGYNLGLGTAYDAILALIPKGAADDRA